MSETPLWHAFRYSSLGWKVLPCHGKTPVRGTRGVHSATTDEARIRRWWERHPDDDISVACNGHFWVLDVDYGHDGYESLSRLTSKHGPLPNTVKQASGGGGTHYFFKSVPGLKQAAGGASKLKREDGTFFWPFRGLDIRAGDALIAVAPTIHPKTGAEYKWEEGCEPWKLELAETPGWLVDLATPPKPKPVDHNPIQLSEARHSAYWSAALAKAVAAIRDAAPGTRDCTLNREAFSIGAAVAAGELRREVALPAIVAASQQMIVTNNDDWTRSYAMKKARNSFMAGMRNGDRGQKIALRA